MDLSQTHSGSRLVVVDPQVDDYRCLVESARQQSVRITLTSIGSQALRLVPSFPDAVWVINPTLPDIDGIHLLEMLHSLQHNLRGVVLDNSYDRQREQRALENRAIQYVCKPLQLEWVTTWLSQNSPQPSHRFLNASQQTPLPSQQTH